MKTYLARSGMLICALAVLAVVNGLANPLAIHVPASTLDAEGFYYGVENDDRPFVGVAFSGGGARAAAFSAAGLQALSEHRGLADITHVSSVSGGGFTASYFALHAPTECSGPQDQSGCEAYFQAMLAEVAPPSMWSLELRQISKPWRILSPSRRLNSLRDVLNRESFLSGKTFSDLPRDRSFYFNAVSYDTGRPFVFSNAMLPSEEAPETPGLPADLRSQTFSTQEEARPNHGDIEVSLAVATSAAFPPYLGPASIEARTGEEFWHLGDGGIVENTGLATLLEALHARPPSEGPVTLYVFDAGQKLDAAASIGAADISVFSSQIPRIVDILNIYGARYREALLTKLAEADGLDVEIVTFDYLDGETLTADADASTKWRVWSKDDWPNCTDDGDTPLERLQAIPTRLTINACNRDLITAAARDLVSDHFKK